MKEKYLNDLKIFIKSKIVQLRFCYNLKYMNIIVLGFFEFKSVNIQIFNKCLNCFLRFNEVNRKEIYFLYMINIFIMFIFQSNCYNINVELSLLEKDG